MPLWTLLTNLSCKWMVTWAVYVSDVLFTTILRYSTNTNTTKSEGSGLTRLMFALVWKSVFSTFLCFYCNIRQTNKNLKICICIEKEKLCEFQFSQNFTIIAATASFLTNFVIWHVLENSLSGTVDCLFFIKIVRSFYCLVPFGVSSIYCGGVRELWGP